MRAVAEGDKAGRVVERVDLIVRSVAVEIVDLGPGDVAGVALVDRNDPGHAGIKREDRKQRQLNGLVRPSVRRAEQHLAFGRRVGGRNGVQQHTLHDWRRLVARTEHLVDAVAQPEQRRVGRLHQEAELAGLGVGGRGELHRAAHRQSLGAVVDQRHPLPLRGIAGPVFPVGLHRRCGYRERARTARYWRRNVAAADVKRQPVSARRKRLIEPQIQRGVVLRRDA